MRTQLKLARTEETTLFTLLLTAFIALAGVESFRRMPVDAYPDLAPPTVSVTARLASANPSR